MSNVSIKVDVDTTAATQALITAHRSSIRIYYGAPHLTDEGADLIIAEERRRHDMGRIVLWMEDTSLWILDGLSWRQRLLKKAIELSGRAAG